MHSTRSDNLGVGALTASQVAILREVAGRVGIEISITVMDWKDPRAPYVTGPDIQIIDLDGRVMISPTGFFSVARRSDLVIDIGAGDSFSDIYGARRLTRMFILKYLTHLARTPLVMAPQTIGPFTKPLSRFLAKLSMRLSTVIATRDQLSTECVHGMGLHAGLIEASDVALRLPYDATRPRNDGRIKVGLNVSGLLMNGGYTGRNDFGLTLDYPGLIRDIIKYFQAHPDGCEVHLVPHVIVEGDRMAVEDDMRASAKLTEEFPDVRLARTLATPSEAKTYISGMDFFMGARMHACIAALSSGVPVVPMAYSRKFDGLFGSIDYHHTVDCTKGTRADALEKIASAYESRVILAQEAATAFTIGRAKLSAYEKAIGLLLRQAAHKVTN